MKEFFKKVKEKFWWIILVLTAVGTIVVAAVIIILNKFKEKVTKKVKDRIKKNDEIIKDGKDISSNVDDFLERKRKEYN